MLVNGSNVPFNGLQKYLHHPEVERNDECDVKVDGFASIELAAKNPHSSESDDEWILVGKTIAELAKEFIPIHLVYGDQKKLKNIYDYHFRIMHSIDHDKKKLDFNELWEFIHSVPENEIDEGWKNYSIFQNPKDAEKMHYDPDQVKWGEWMCQTVKIAVKGIEEKKWDFDELMVFLCAGRGFIGDNKQFGCPRVPKDAGKSTSFMVNAYTPLGEYFLSIKPNNITIIEEESKIPDVQVYLIQGKINEKVIPLSKIYVNKPVRLEFRFKDSLYYGMIEHTSWKKSKMIMEYVKHDIFPAALSENNQDELMKILGRMFWWICQAKPWFRGDPSIAEALIRTLWNVKGFESFAWKDGVIPWVEVMKASDVDQFAANFYTLFIPQCGPNPSLTHTAV